MTLTDLFRDVEGGLYRGGYSRLEKPSNFAAFRHFAYSLRERYVWLQLEIKFSTRERVLFGFGNQGKPLSSKQW
jgi:hypothetical protein